MSSPFASGPGPAAVYFAFRAAAWLAEHTPRPIAYLVAHLGARAAYGLVERKRVVVEKNLARVIGSGEDLDKAVRAAFEYYAEYWLETFRLGRYTREDLLRMVQPVGDSVKVIEDGFAEGKGILVLTPHLGFYDMGVAWVGAMGWKATTVAEVLRPKTLFEWFVRIRERQNLSVLPARNGKWVREKLAAVLDAGEMVALVADRDLGRRGVWVTFLGEATTFPVSPAILAVQKGVPVIVAAITRRGKIFDMYFERVPYSLSGDYQTDVRTVAQVTADALERMVRRDPEQWHMFSTNWPAEEGHLPPRGRKSDVLPGGPAQASGEPPGPASIPEAGSGSELTGSASIAEAAVAPPAPASVAQQGSPSVPEEAPAKVPEESSARVPEESPAKVPEESPAE